MIVSTSSRRNKESEHFFPEEQDNVWGKQAAMSTTNSSQRAALRREQAHIVDLNVYPAIPGSLTTLGSAVIQVVGSGSLTKGLMDAGLPVSFVSWLICILHPFSLSFSVSFAFWNENIFWQMRASLRSILSKRCGVEIQCGALQNATATPTTTPKPNATDVSSTNTLQARIIIVLCCY
jgi:hypothetical protein